MKIDVQYRPAKSQDAKSMVAIHYKAVHAISIKVYIQAVLAAWSPKPDKNRVDWLEAVIENRNSCCFVAEKDKRVIGFSIVLLSEKKLQGIYVNPKLKREGVGRELMTLAESAASKNGVRSLSLKASINSAPFYEKLGYQAKGDTTQLLSNGLKMDAINMVKQMKTSGKKKSWLD